MNRRSIVAAVVLTLVTAGFCFADTLVITYRSGKTQTVTLDEPSTTINSWQFVGGTSAAVPQQSTPQQQVVHEAARPESVKEEAKPAAKPAEKKSNVRVQWNAKPIPD